MYLRHWPLPQEPPPPPKALKNLAKSAPPPPPATIIGNPRPVKPPKLNSSLQAWRGFGISLDFGFLLKAIWEGRSGPPADLPCGGGGVINQEFSLSFKDSCSVKHRFDRLGLRLKTCGELMIRGTKTKAYLLAGRGHSYRPSSRRGPGTTCDPGFEVLGSPRFLEKLVDTR